MLAVHCSLEKGCLLSTWGERVLDLSAIRQDRKICFLLKWQLSMTMPTLEFDAYTKTRVLRGILLLISKKIEDNHL